MKRTYSAAFNYKTVLRSFFIAIIFLASLSPAKAVHSPHRTRVLITFATPPGLAEENLVRSAGGDIRYTYTLVSAIAASVPVQALDGLRNNPRIILIEPDLAVQLADTELDSAWGVKHIGAGIVHDGGVTGAGIRVGIIDSGIDLDHPDLQYDPSCSKNFIETETLDDGHSHGTHVAGSIAALDNDSGVVGVAPGVTLCIYKVFDSAGNSSYSDIIAAVQQAVLDGVDVTNNSYGSSADPGAAVKAAFDAAADAGVLQIAAAGNYGNIFGSGENCIYPARWNSVVAVAATNPDDTRPYFSSTCAEVEIAAPGASINSTMPGGGYGLKNGTSMASPHAAGTAALVLAANPGWTAGAVRTQLQATSVDLGNAGRDPWYGFGRIDAFAAAGGVTNAPPVADDQSVVTPENTPVAITLTASDPDGDPLSYSIVTGPSNGVLDGAAPNLTYTPNTGFSGNDSFSFKANDGLADSNTATVSITVEAVNAPPAAHDQSVTTQENTPVAIVLTASDPDGDPLTYTVGTGPTNGTLDGTPPSLTYTPSPGFSGSDSFTFKANDGAIDSNMATISITVETAPLMVNSKANSEVPVAGTVNGDYSLTHEDDSISESITERDSGGKPQNRYSYLEHIWVFSVTPGSAVTLHANAWSSGSSDGDSFIFAFSTNNIDYTELFIVSNTSDGAVFSYALPAATQGTVYIRVTDSDRSTGNRSQDTVYVDHLYIRSESLPGDPPAAPTGLTANAVSATRIDLAWTDHADDEYGFQIERSQDGSNWTQIDSVGANVTAYTDSGVSANTTYIYRVRAYNGSGASVYTDPAGAATPDGLQLAATGYKVKGVQTVELAWSGGEAAAFDIYRDGGLIAAGVTGFSYTDSIGIKGGGSYVYSVCAAGNPANCSNEVRVDF